MTGQTFLQLFQICTILIGFLGLAVSVRSHRRQMHAQMYIEFSARFHNILRTLPVQTWMPSGEGAQALPARSEELTRTCMQCFHIIADLYRLHEGGLINGELWGAWQRHIRRAMRRPVFRREWLAVEASFEHDPELCGYMRGMIGDGSAETMPSHATGIIPAAAAPPPLGSEMSAEAPAHRGASQPPGWPLEDSVPAISYLADAGLSW